jgi:glycogen operon protein
MSTLRGGKGIVRHKRTETKLEFQRGSPLPLGAEPLRGGVNFAIFSRHATAVSLLLFHPGDDNPHTEFLLDPRYHRTGDIWHTFVRGLDVGAHYGWRMDRQPNTEPHVHRFDPSQALLDPYARMVVSEYGWGPPPSGRIKRRRCVVVDDDFDWGDDQPLNIPLRDTIIYEMHVRGYTRHPSSGVRHPGTFLGVIEKIPYLKELGVTSVELLPVNEFEEADTDRYNPKTGELLLNFWGYQPIAFFAPNGAYATHSGAQIREFKQMVKSLHEAGIEVILDVVFNHTAEGDERGPTYSFRGIDNAVYYIVDPHTGRYHNYSGCGNTLNCNHPVVRKLINDALRYWVMEMHVDGFRFDLASVLGRGRDGRVLADPPLLEQLAHDPVLAHTKLIAEAWDAAGLYQVGTFPAWRRWAEWNGKFRDDVRRFVKSDPGMTPALAARLAGSPDLYESSGRQPYHSINFVTCHDGFTLEDLVSYNQKHNEENGEDNRDGMDQNFSWNCGVEGPTNDPAILALRKRQKRNFAALLLVAGGVPMILAGDEFGRTQRGNNNAYCQDNEISWIDWRLASANRDLLRFFKNLIAFRKAHSALRRISFENNGAECPQIQWHGVKPLQPDWSYESRALAMSICGTGEDGQPEHIYVLANAWWEPLRFQLPALPHAQWARFVDTALPPPEDIAEVGGEKPLEDPTAYEAAPRSVVILVSQLRR